MFQRHETLAQNEGYVSGVHTLNARKLGIEAMNCKPSRINRSYLDNMMVKNFSSVIVEKLRVQLAANNVFEAEKAKRCNFRTRNICIPVSSVNGIWPISSFRIFWHDEKIGYHFMCHLQILRYADAIQNIKKLKIRKSIKMQTSTATKTESKFMNMVPKLLLAD
uniref:PiggyBac transposable element-derived protein domain-containing protein n=1 Tax=Romanomermis culicivorax TaxID=13658 RepID=A0A915LA84_ROMCU